METGTSKIKLEILKIFKISFLTQCLTEYENDIKIQLIVLRTLCKLLEFGKLITPKSNYIKIEIDNEEIVPIIRKIQYGNNKIVSKEASELIDLYWGDNDEVYFEI